MAGPKRATAARTATSRRRGGASQPTDPPALESALARVLQLGTYVSVALIATGSVLLLATGRSPLEGGPALELPALLSDIVDLRPAGYLWLGILGVLATPALRVVRALLGFARRSERSMVATSAGVLVVIVVGVIVGVTAH